eukprot:7382996-Heterocapsa_arctica.AAC.1
MTLTESLWRPKFVSNAEQKRTGFNQEYVFVSVPFSVRDETPVRTGEHVAIDLIEASAWELWDRAGMQAEGGRINVQRVGQGMLASARCILVVEAPTL